jgi:predicted dehydrogenase
LGYGVIGQEDGGTLDAMFLGEQGGYVAQQDTNKAHGQTIEVEFGNAYAREIASFSNSLLTGAPVEVPAQQAVQVQRIMEAAYRSNDEKITITL